MKTIITHLRYVLLHGGHFGVYLTLTTVARIIENLQPFFFRAITASATSAEFNQALIQAVALGAVLILGTLTFTVAWAFGDRGIVKSAIDLQLDVMKKIHNLDFAYHTAKSSGKLISLMKRGEDAFFNMFDILYAEMLAVFISLTIMLFAFASLDIKYIAITLLSLVVSVIAGTPIIKVNLRRRRKFNDTEDAATAARVDNLVNFDTVKYFAKEKYEQTRLLNLLTDWYRAAQSYFNTYRYLDLSIGNISNLAIAGTIILAVIDLSSGELLLPDFVLITTFAVSFFPKLFHVAMVFRNWARRFSDLQSYFAVLSEKETVVDPTNPVQLSTYHGQIEFQNIKFSYHSAGMVFNDFSLQISPGETVALVGISGSGKTTLVKLLMRMYDLQSGSIRIDGTDIKQMSKSHLRSLIGIVPQDPLMFNHTLRYNVAYANQEASESQIWDALRQSKLDDFVRSLPEGLETQVGERGIKLSGGQRQRLAIARVLLEKAKIILLDEATSSLDSESEGIVQDAFWHLVKDPQSPRTSIIIAHRLSTIMRCDRIIVLDEGKISQIGTHKQLLKNKKGIYYHLWSLQQNGFLLSGQS